jgi:hypothetical protein
MGQFCIANGLIADKAYILWVEILGRDRCHFAAPHQIWLRKQ